jgi:hypothetical protein
LLSAYEKQARGMEALARAITAELRRAGSERESVARVVGMDDDTLRKHFREEIDTGGRL